jgi:hypothetical protein
MEGKEKEKENEVEELTRKCKFATSTHEKKCQTCLFIGDPFLYLPVGDSSFVPSVRHLR